MRISTWLTLVYAAVLVFVLVFTSIVSAIGIYYSLYHQAEIELMRSQEHVLSAIEHGTEIFNETAPDMRRRYPLAFAVYEDDLLMPGVVLRVTEGADSPVVYESDTHYPSINLVEAHIDQHPPLWANSAMYVSTIGNTQIYYHKIIINQSGHTYVLHFFRTITAERHFLTTLQKVLTITNLAGIVLALAAGYFISCRILRPIRTMTQAARSLEVTDLGRRIAVPPVKDELAELAETFNHMLDRIQAGFEQQRRFVSDASHELRTPLAAIRGYGELYRMGGVPPERQSEVMGRIEDEASRMGRLVEDLLQLARIDEGRKMTMERVDLTAVCSGALTDMTVLAPDRACTLIPLTSDGKPAPAVVIGDRDRLSQVITNLLGNVVRHTPPGTPAEIAVGPVGENAVVEVRDHGPGVDSAEADKVFQRFYRADSSRNRKTGGSGLGLAIVLAIIKHHGGSVRILQTPGGGATVHLEVPLAPTM